jgi:hypothetical protein
MQECLNAGLVELAMHVLSTATICDFMTVVLHVRGLTLAVPLAACICIACDGVSMLQAVEKGAGLSSCARAGLCVFLCTLSSAMGRRLYMGPARCHAATSLLCLALK